MLAPRLRTIVSTLSVGVALVACGGKGKGAAHPSGSDLALTEAGLAGITATTPVDAATLGRLVPGADIRPDPDNADVLGVWRDGGQLFYVVQRNQGRPADGPFGVHVTSPTIPGPHGWRVGATLAAPDGLDACTCWQDLRVCYQTGAHVAVAIDRDDCLDLPGLGASVGKPIARLIWNPVTWPQSPPTDDGAGTVGDPCGGDGE